MKSARKRSSSLTRSAAMDARPHPMPAIRTEEESDGSIKILIRFQRSKWQKWFGAPPEYERQYLLDALGREVFEACDGNAPVSEIIKRYADAHNVNIAEAEMAVTQYLKTLMMKGIIGMAI